MSATTGTRDTSAGTALPILYRLSFRRVPDNLEGRNLGDLRKVARFWLGSEDSKLPWQALVTKLRQALMDDATAGRVFRALSPQDRAVIAVYRRFGGSVAGEVIRIDLLARGLLEIVEQRYSDHYTQRRWKHDPITGLADRWVLFPEKQDPSYAYSAHTYGIGPDSSFPRYGLHAGLALHAEPAGPAPWTLPAAKGIPEAITGRSPAEVALDLSRIFAYLAARGPVKTRKDGSLSVPALRALEKAVPLDGGSEFRLPVPHGLYLGLLWHAGLIRAQGNEIAADPAAAVRLFAEPGFRQADSWARGWLSTGHWLDGIGILEGRTTEEVAESVRTGREVLAWALGCLARAGDRWYELETFLSGLHALQGYRRSYFSYYSRVAWDPKLTPAQGKETETGPARERAWWFSKEGTWYANAVMVTLVALGLVERARLGHGATAPLGFRLTDLGRAAFGAPEVAPPPEPEDRRCLVIQPNFDVIAYLDQAGARTAGILGRIAESGSARSGPIQTFRLTQASVYQAEENGLSHDQIVEFLRRHGQLEPPANVVRSLADWSGKRESLAIRPRLLLLGFPATADRDAYLERHPGTACGERFVLADHAERGQPAPRLPGSLTVEHLADRRQTLELDEEGEIRLTQPLDIVQRSRLLRIAEPPISASKGWRITADSLRRAAASGLKPGIVHNWLEDHLANPTPPLIARAIDAWLRVGRSRPLELADAVLLHVPDRAQYEAFTRSQRLRPFLHGSPGLGWLIVKKEARKELAATLEELGFTVKRELSPGEMLEDV